MTKGLRIWRSKGLQPTLDTNAYSSGDALGVKTQITGAPDAGVIRTIQIADDADQNIDINVWLFDSEPTGVADDAALALADADAAKLINVVLVDTRVDGTNNRIGVEQPNLFYRTDGGELWFQLSTGGTPTYAATSLTVRFTIEY